MISTAALKKMQLEALQAAKERVEARRRSSKAWELRGANLEIQTISEPELLLVGAAGTGKTLAILLKINRLMWEYPGARALIVRKVRADIAQSTLVTFERDVLGEDNPICAGIQRENRAVYRYPNGSEIVVGGMDRPGRILSAEYDLIYPAEAVQFDEQDWETFVMRCRNYVIPFQQVIGDTNPDRPDHWLKQRCDTGKTRLLNSFHRDNPAYFDLQANDWTPRGRDYVLDKLNRLSGVRRERYLLGKWTIAEGSVYEEWNEAVHVIDRFDIPADWRRLRAIDFGFTNPFVCQWWAIDPDGRMYLYREIYKSRRLVEDHARDIVRLSEGERIEATVADHDAEDRATLQRHGVPTLAAVKDIQMGIQAVQARLRVQEDGKPRLFVMRGALVEWDESLNEDGKPTSTASEFPGYVWPKDQNGKPKKETPVDEDNHGMDTTRYAVRYLDRPKARSRRNSIYGD